MASVAARPLIGRKIAWLIDGRRRTGIVRAVRMFLGSAPDHAPYWLWVKCDQNGLLASIANPDHECRRTATWLD